MKYLQLASTRRLISLALFMCHFAGANRLILVPDSFLDCVRALKNDSNPHAVVRINRMKFQSTIERCPTRIGSLEKMLRDEKQLKIKTGFAANKIILVLTNKRVVISRRDTKGDHEPVPNAGRFLGLGHLSSVASKIKSAAIRTQPKSPIQPVERSVSDKHQQVPQQNQQRTDEQRISHPAQEPMQLKPPQTTTSHFPSQSARISGTVVDVVFQFIQFLWSYSNNLLKSIINRVSKGECFEIPTIEKRFPGFYILLERFQLCGLANARLWPMTKTMGQGYWNVTVITEHRNMTMTFGKFALLSPSLPWPLTNINLDSIQLHFDGIKLRTSIIYPFDLLIIPVSFRIDVAKIDNLKVRFLTPNPTMQQQLLATSLEKGARFLLELLFKYISEVGDYSTFWTR